MPLTSRRFALTILLIIFWRVFSKGKLMSLAQDANSREQIRQLESEIEALRNGHRTMYSRKFAEFFAHAKEIGQLFKESHSISHRERERLWGDFRALCDSVKDRKSVV